jgi:hypothetical protein
LHLIELLAEAGDLGLDFGITAQRAEQPNVGCPSRIQSRRSSGAFRRLNAKRLVDLCCLLGALNQLSILTCAR